MRPQTIYIEKAAKNDLLTEEIYKRFNDKNIVYINKVSDLKDIALLPKKKRALVLAHNRGIFFERCPCTKYHHSCGYFILNLGSGCPYDCTYCFLQHYQKIAANIVYTNLDKLYTELSQKIGNKRVRLGTGEFIDSVAFEKYFPWHQIIVPEIIKRCPNILLELKTKSGDTCLINNLEKYKKNIIFGWSLNPPRVIKKDEKLSASLNKRLKAIELAQKKGYRIAIHFDPIIIYPGWESDYQKLIIKLSKVLDAKKVAWFSLGLLRFVPALKEKVERRHPKSTIIYGEFFPGEDKKMRYPEPLRIQAFSQIVNHLHTKISPDLPLYYCMESVNIWRQTLSDKHAIICKNLRIEK